MPGITLGPLLRYVDEQTRRSGSRRTPPARSRCWGARPRRSASAGITTRSSSSRASSPGARSRTGRASTASRPGPRPSSELPPSMIRTIDPESELRIAFGSCRVTMPHDHPTTCPGRGRPRARATTPCAPTRCGCSGSRPRSGRSCCSCWATRSTRTRTLPRRGSSSARAAASRGAGSRRSRTSRSTRSSTAKPGASPWCAGCSRPSASRCCSTTTTSTTIGTSRSTGSRRCARSHGGTPASPAALVCYWVYQHIGNLSPTRLRERGILERAQRARGRVADAARLGPRGRLGQRGPALELLARPRAGASFVFMDSREGRVLGDTPRRMFDDGEWKWLKDSSRATATTCVVADTLPVMLPPAMHDLEAWNEAVCNGAWGGPARAGEKVRRAPRPRALGRLSALLPPAHGPHRRRRRRAPGRGAGLDRDPGRRHPSRLSGRGRVPARAKEDSKVWQAVCSPYRNPLVAHERRVASLGWNPGRRGDRQGARPLGGGARRRRALAVGRARHLRQPDRHFAIQWAARGPAPGEGAAGALPGARDDARAPARLSSLTRP